MHQKRVRNLRSGTPGSWPVIYWMDRELRMYDNWALVYAIQQARQAGKGLEIVYNLDPNFLGGTLRQLDFKCRSLQVLEAQSSELWIPFHVVSWSRTEELVVEFVRRKDSHMLVTDFSPLRIQRDWKQHVSNAVSIPFFEVDAHNIVPAWEASDKMEYQAATFRPKIRRLLPDYSDDFPDRWFYRMWAPVRRGIDFDRLYREAETDRSVTPTAWIIPGPDAAETQLEQFIWERITRYADDRNNPNRDAQSGLSPYLHYGNIAPQRVMQEVLRADIDPESKEVFLEELIVRREVAENFCLYCPSYDRIDGAWNWARETLAKHSSDPRDRVYSYEEFDQANTHDPLWNAAQIEMKSTGKMHWFMRMYWAKKILEWSESPESAIQIAIRLNDRYSLDGRDPNGYVGIMWSICGVHDRAWFERPVYGKIRYMNRNGCEKKFDVLEYIERVIRSSSSLQ